MEPVMRRHTGCLIKRCHTLQTLTNHTYSCSTSHVEVTAAYVIACLTPHDLLKTCWCGDVAGTTHRWLPAMLTT